MTEIRAAYPLSPMQQGLLFHHLSEERPGVDLEQIVCSLHESLDAVVFTRAWEAVVDRHDVLRTRFRWEGLEDPAQEVLESVALPVRVEDWRGAASGDHEARLAAYLAEDRRRGFDLARAPLLRLFLARTGDETWEVVWTFHHILLDGRSFPIVLREVFGLYEDLRRGAKPALPPVRAYREHVAHVAQQDPAAAERFWRGRLAGFAGATPLPGARAVASSDEATERGELEWRLGEASTVALGDLARREGLGVGTLVRGAWALLLARHAGLTDVVFGATRAGRAASVEGAEQMVGLFINTLPVRVHVDPAAELVPWLREQRGSEREVRPFEQTPLVEVQGWSEVPAGTPLFESLVVYDDYVLDSLLRDPGGAWERRHFRLLERTNYPLTLYAQLDRGRELAFKLAWDRSRFEEGAVERIAGQLGAVLAAMAADPGGTLADLPLLTEDERERMLGTWNDTARDFPRDRCIHELIEAQVDRTPEATALVAGGERLSYRALDERANRLARLLRARGVGPGDRVGVCLDRGVDLVVALLAVHKAGGAYVPLDPDYPQDRLALILEDAGTRLVVTTGPLLDTLPETSIACLRLDREAEALAREPAERLGRIAEAGELAYVIYTSGSTGRPKGVMVEHRSVVNFFTAMDEHVPHDPPGTWLAVTSLSFDISVLELLWTLARGFEVVLHTHSWREPRAGRSARRSDPLEFSLFYFSSAQGEAGPGGAYRLLLEGARFADERGFAAVWTPERHFHAFGGLFPNPAVTGAALAAATRRVGIRAGSVVLPLHHPARVAEEWALVDNLSGGRVGMAFASGWQPDDFVLAPDNHAQAKEVLFRNLEVVRRLWRGETVAFPGPGGRTVEIGTLPRPVQPELPVWVTTTGNAATYQKAGEIGANVLTHLLGQTLAEVEKNIRVYREAWRAAGHGPGDGHVTLMLHTFVGDDVDAVRETVRGPMKGYLGSSLGLIRNFASAWSAFKRRADGTAEAGLDVESLSPEEKDGLLDYSFERYFETSALFGTPESLAERLEQLEGIGIDELACLIDFGVSTELTLAHLAHLDRLRDVASARAASAPDETLAARMRRHGVTHLQCTPSLARVLLADEEAPAALAGLRVMLVGGEAFPADLADALGERTDARLLNVYGPTETTIWSTLHEVEPGAGAPRIGRPLANTEVYVLDAGGEPVPVGVPGELHIGGAGLARGYLNQPELTAERFVPHPIRRDAGERVYRTGDRARWHADGTLEFLGRTDHQVKLRGHRIELGEIETVLQGHPGVGEAVVVARTSEGGDPRLVAYWTPAKGARAEEAQLRAHLRAKLPEFMVPARLIPLDALPLTPNGKIDRRALPHDEPQPVAAAGAGAPPANEVERRIAEVWCEILGVARVGREDNFFELGGHSLLAVKAHRRLQEVVSRESRITDLFRYPTVRALAAFLADGTPGDALARSRERAEQRLRSLAVRRRQRARRSGEGEPEVGS